MDEKTGVPVVCGVFSTPAVVVNGVVKIVGTVSKRPEILRWLAPE